MDRDQLPVGHRNRRLMEVRQGGVLQVDLLTEDTRIKVIPLICQEVG